MSRAKIKCPGFRAGGGLPFPDILRNTSCYKKPRILLSTKLKLWYSIVTLFSSKKLMIPKEIIPCPKQNLF